MTPAPPTNVQSGEPEIRMLHDRVLLDPSGQDGERRSGGGIVIPATASVGRRLAWASVVAAGPHVRQVVVGDRVLYDPEVRAEVEVMGKDHILVRERDLHAVAPTQSADKGTGLYL